MNRNAEARPAPSRTRNAPGHNAFPASLRPGDPSSRPRFRTARDSARETQSQSDSNSVTDMRARHCSSLLERRQRLKFTREDLNPSAGLSRAAAVDTESNSESEFHETQSKASFKTLGLTRRIRFFDTILPHVCLTGRQPSVTSSNHALLTVVAIAQWCGLGHVPEQSWLTKLRPQTRSSSDRMPGAGC